MGTQLDYAKALDFEEIRDGESAEAIETDAGSRYTQHSTPVLFRVAEARSSSTGT